MRWSGLSRNAFRSLTIVFSCFLLVMAGSVSVTAAPTPADGDTLNGEVRSAADDANWNITAWISGVAGARAPAQVGSAVSGANGRFSISVDEQPADGSILYLLARPAEAGHGTAPTLASVTGIGSSPFVVMSERTTVATGYAMAQFIDNDGINGTDPGISNSAAMITNLVDPATGELGRVLTSSPNGSQTSTLATFNTLTDMHTACSIDHGRCAELISESAVAGAPRPTDTLRAFAQIARSPSDSVLPLFALSKFVTAPSTPTLSLPPVAWTLALRFDGGGGLLSGPGNFAIDHLGNIWVDNNYQYNADPQTPVCGSDLLFKFGPTGTLVDGAPFTGGGLSGAGFGIDLDNSGNVWVSNYGFAAPEPGCATADQPPHNSLSKFTPDGTPLSPDETGFTQGGVTWPQGMEVSDDDDVWVTNCADDSVTVYRGGDPGRAQNFNGLGLDQPFDVIDNGRNIFVSGIVSDNIAILGSDGKPRANSPVSGPHLDHPMGLATDNSGNVWVANSGVITLPCPDRPTGTGGSGSVAALGPDGQPLVGPLRGGGVTVPWGLTTDGDGNVWVANFAGKRISSFCGVDTSTCPPGSSTGDALSPDGLGYFFDGLERSTGIAVDQSGNVWVTNNWKDVPLEANPGGEHIVVYLGMAAPVSIPVPR